MKKLKFLSLLLILTVALFSCKDDDNDNNDNGATEGKITATIDGKPTEFVASAISYSSTYEGKHYEYVAVSGTNGAYGSAGYSSFVVTVYAEKLQAKIYPVPTYDENYQYDFFSGYSMGTFMTSANTYITYSAAGASGSVTIESISASNIKGSYDMTLTNINNDSTTVKLKGNFNAKIIQVITE